MFAGWNDWNTAKEAEGRKSGYAISIAAATQWVLTALP